ncbi:MAG: radical SAM protein [Candidatus Undinarchaeales archaeon]|nr:radical SAM protein [Candidatus Undinarchaeales archaeon]MDP7493474.1 radical SAM protein [Candidatus Undinarchaeales archaeon]
MSQGAGTKSGTLTVYDYCCNALTRSSFPSVSVTGAGCSLDCAHCGRTFLRHMHAATTPESLSSFLDELWARGGAGCLVSGGCDRDGRVPLRPFLPVLAEAKRTTGLQLNVHCGLVNAEDARILATTDVDVVSLDLIGDRSTAREVYGLDRGPEDYLGSYRSLISVGIPVVPHITIGLHFGMVRGERTALEMAASMDAPLVVFLVLLPTPGTRMADVEPPSSEAVTEVFASARELLPETELALGCMRPRGPEGRVIERLALEHGFERMAMPSLEVHSAARRLGIEVIKATGCCTLPVPHW